ncbi:MAG TPA: hypothetical protein VF982_00255 [Anaerolineales bacterium]
MARKYQRRGQPSASPISTPTEVEPVSMDALNTPTPETAPAADFELYPDVPAPKMVAMELLRNYRPAGDFDIVGHMVPAVTRKDASGREYEMEKARFVEGEGAPPPISGVGTIGKIWAGTIIRVPQDEARTMRANDIAERSVDD